MPKSNNSLTLLQKDVNQALKELTFKVKDHPHLKLVAEMGDQKYLLMRAREALSTEGCDLDFVMRLLLLAKAQGMALNRRQDGATTNKK